LRVDPDTGLSHSVAANVRQKTSLIGVGQRKVDGVVAGLDAEGGLHRQAGKRPVEGSRRAGAGQDTVVVLVKLVAERRIVEKIGEVVEEIERAFDHIGIGLPRSRIIGARDPRR
jgi:hypothetical protein